MKKINGYKEMSKSEKKKLQKEKKLFEAAYELFTLKGINNTAISEIVKRAGVAKGTFYLYFKDKYDIVDLIIIRKSNVILNEAMEIVIKSNVSDFEENVILFVNHIIEILQKDKKLLKLIYKNLSWGLFYNAFKNMKNYENARRIITFFIDELYTKGIPNDEAEKILFMIVELTSSVLYSSIILEEPDTIENMKPLLFKTIRKILRN
ncbi:putative HTH-type transcriptional regulator YvdT [Clostridium tepidiprofundi DSM 19306]|uniref:Putative HTH-type transcriptional regulator YvdT n=1 Tax=Clostridium tepidiprofundi DSM 19306 TaxID=1121338 RepID=A0A151B3Y6_9CLOT|nr:TetR/AcrR family transcriptional regulator [Clostridium tepidiprofundi]KYH34625.1 putative HTH-type transcriptional regulator YvdT [Clostridium tepidiprofundi DSM 19306]